MPGCFFCVQRWRCTSRFGPWGKGVRTGPHRQFAKKHFHFGGKHAILYDRIGEMNSSDDARRLRNGQFCRFNSHPARGRKQYGKDVALAGTWDLTHTPQGDGDNLPNVSSSNSEDLTHTPQGDDNSSMLSSSSSVTGINSHPARGRKPIPVDKDDNQAFGFNSHPARGHNRRTFSAPHRRGRKGPSAFLFFYVVFPTGHGGRAFLWV